MKQNGIVLCRQNFFAVVHTQQGSPVTQCTNFLCFLCVCLLVSWYLLANSYLIMVVLV